MPLTTFSGKTCNIQAKPLDFRASNGENIWATDLGPPNRNCSCTPMVLPMELSRLTHIFLHCVLHRPGVWRAWWRCYVWWRTTTTPRWSTRRTANATTSSRASSSSSWSASPRTSTPKTGLPWGWSLTGQLTLWALILQVHISYLHCLDMVMRRFIRLSALSKVVWHICTSSRSPWNFFCRWLLTSGEYSQSFRT